MVWEQAAPTRGVLSLTNRWPREGKRKCTKCIKPLRRRGITSLPFNLPRNPRFPAGADPRLHFLRDKSINSKWSSVCVLNSFLVWYFEDIK